MTPDELRLAWPTLQARVNEASAAALRAQLARNAAVVDAHISGLSVRRIAEITGLSVARVGQIVKGAGK